MKGNRDNFQEVTALDLANWASSPVHAVDVIEDVLNLGLTYIVEVGDIATFPVSKFTIRITPHVAADQTEPGYVQNAPAPLSDYVSSAGTVAITPAPTFTIGEELQIVVADKDIAGNATVDVNVSVGPDNAWKVITLNEIDGRAVFTATLPTFAGTISAIADDGKITVTAGTTVTVTYTDDYNGTDTNVPVTATTSTQPSIEPSIANNDSTKSIFSATDDVSLIVMILGFLTLGAYIARRRLAK